MAPRISTLAVTEVVEVAEPHKPIGTMTIVWKNVILFLFLHAFAFYGIYLLICHAMWQTNAFGLFYAYFTILGITGGAHRLWSHRAYKAKLPLRILLMIMNSGAGQNDIYEWTRDHRVHHKFSETDADPHNMNRGFFFAHMGWLMCKKHPDVLKKGKGIDCSDLLQDPVVAFQKKYYLPLTIFFCFTLPTIIPPLCWGDTYMNAYCISTMLRYALTLHGTWLVNSAAHLWGTKPYDKGINPTETPVCMFFYVGEFFHNYHHTFPWDYRASEFGTKYNLTTAFINLMAWLGQAYDLKTVPTDVMEKRMDRTGDGTRKFH